MSNLEKKISMVDLLNLKKRFKKHCPKIGICSGCRFKSECVGQIDCFLNYISYALDNRK